VLNGPRGARPIGGPQCATRARHQARVCGMARARLPVRTGMEALSTVLTVGR
jgi:hypothetical protein